ncbi:IS4 family transposase [Cyanobacterium aponinum AL20118]|uniref:IS4 family transposase n=1 Tax=Cyanobacterium aponinum AL20115 TaxID=3090662 RepID=A0AAF0ZEP7_9CHRO|nr:IS4 family transposase [Cyanobacterium aponinum]WPF90390.1 IS4 family transposase [Cyanobacterium aponinum AL20115]
MSENDAIVSHLSELLTPSIFAQQSLFRDLGMRNRVLNLSLMTAAILTLLWRNVPSVNELTRILNREGFLWVDPTKVSQKALSDRFLTFPSILFEQVFKQLLPKFKERWQKRTNRPLPDSVCFSLTKFKQIWIVDGSTLEALFRKLDSLKDIPTGKLAGKMAVVMDLATRLPVEIWVEENPSISEVKFEENILNLVKSQTLLLLDRGFYHFLFWQELITRNIDFITRIKKGASIEILKRFTNSHDLRDSLINIGDGRKKTPIVTLRLVEIRSKNKWHSYLTSVTSPEILPPHVVVNLYGKRWRIEEAFNTVKRLLGLSYLWTGSINGIKLQIWGTWLFYGVLIDLGDAVAEELSLPFDSISIEMIYRGLYHFIVANNKGKAKEVVKYFSAPENRDLGIIKRKRKPRQKLIIAPFPELGKNQKNFFFENSFTPCF